MPLNDDDRAELVAYLDGELDEAATREVEARIAADPATRAELDSLKQTWGMLDFLPKASPSANFTNRTLERLTLEKVRGPSGSARWALGRRARWPMAVGWAATVLVALAGGYLATARYWPGGPEPIPDADLPLVRHLRIAEKWRLYENADDVEFVKKLAHPDLFGDDPG